MLLESFILKHKNEEIDSESELSEGSSTITLEDT